MDKAKVIISTPKAPERVPVVELREAPAGSQPVGDMRKAWRATITHIQRDHSPLAALLKDALFHIAEQDKVIIHVRYKYHLEKLTERKNLALLEDSFAAVAGLRLNLIFELNQSIPAQENRRQIGSSLSSTDVSSVFQASS